MDKKTRDKLYKKKYIKQMAIDLNKTTDLDLIQWLQMKPNRAAYIKGLIRADIDSNRKEN